MGLDPFAVATPSPCACCHLVDTTVEVNGKLRCSMCRAMCGTHARCQINKWLLEMPYQKDTLNYPATEPAADNP